MHDTAADAWPGLDNELLIRIRFIRVGDARETNGVNSLGAGLMSTAVPSSVSLDSRVFHFLNKWFGRTCMVARQRRNQNNKSFHNKTLFALRNLVVKGFKRQMQSQHPKTST